MSRRYTLLSAASYIPLSPHEVIVKGSALEGFSLLVEDPERRGITASIIRALEDGAHTPEELAGILDSAVSPEACGQLLETMRESGVLGVNQDSEPADLETIWSAFVRYGELPDPSLLRPVTVVSSRDADGVLEGARAWGIPLVVVRPDEINLTDFAPAAPLHNGETDTVALRRDRKPVVHFSFESERAEMYRLNEQAVAAGVSVLYSRLDGVEYTVGPYVVPGQTACAWEAERLWARSSADREQYETLLRHRSSQGHTSSNVVGQAGLSSALAVSLLELSLRGTSERAGTVVHGRSTTHQVSTHSLMRLPRCPVCLPMQPLARNPLY